MPAKKVATAVLTSKGMLFKKPEKSPYIWATFKRKFVTKNLQKSPNLVTLVVAQIRKQKLIRLSQIAKNQNLAELAFGIICHFFTGQCESPIREDLTTQK